MYESPVKVWEDVTRICEEITKAKEEYIFSQIRAVVDVDKEELLKALQYDRRQYEKGYSDGVAARDAEIVRCKDCKWYDISYPYGTAIPDAYYCKVNDRYYDCGHYCAYGERSEDGERKDSDFPP